MEIKRIVNQPEAGPEYGPDGYVVVGLESGEKVSDEQIHTAAERAIPPSVTGNYLPGNGPRPNIIRNIHNDYWDGDTTW